MAPEDLDWFCVPEGFSAGAVVALPHDEAQHALKSLRLKPGDPLVLFDGRGSVAQARVEGTTRRELTARVERIDSVPASAASLWLAAGVVRGPRFDFVIEKATELGVTGFIPLLTRHSEVRPAAGGEKSERWRRLTLAAAKQSRRAWLPELLPPLPLEELPGRFPGARLWVAHPEPDEFVARQSVENKASSGGVSGEGGGGVDLLLTGPEGGWHSDELRDLAAGGARFVHLGAARLRAETAALGLLVWLLSRRESVRDRGTP